MGEGPLANRKVVLVRLCKTENGWRRYPAVIGKNGRVKPGFVTVGGQEREYTEGRYQLRTYEGSRMVYRDAGENAASALTAQTKAEHLLEARAAAKAAGVKVEEDAPGRLSLARELNRFVQAAQDRGSVRAAEAYRQAGDDFLKIIGRVYADEVTPDDLLRHQRELRKRGQAPRTIHNRHVCIVAFLKYLKLDAKALAPVAPKYEKKLPQTYSAEELKAFFASLKDKHLRIIFELLLKTGLREREAVFLFWENIDLVQGVLKVRSKPDLGFRIKDAEERDIPIPADLLTRLKAYRKQHPNIRFVTGTRTDNPNGKLLRTLKRLVNAAGLNCGKCEGCIEHKECERWWLHKFRSTCITSLLRSGMDLRTVMKFSGHSDLASVMRYLAPAEDEAIKAQVNAVKWM
jgi:integrase